MHHVFWFLTLKFRRCYGVRFFAKDYNGRRWEYLRNKSSLRIAVCLMPIFHQKVGVYPTKWQYFIYLHIRALLARLSKRYNGGIFSLPCYLRFRTE